MTRAWIFLAVAGLLEIGWAVSLKLTDGFTRHIYFVSNVLFGLGAAFCLAQAMRSIPASTAYSIWKGVAVVGLIAWELAVDGEPASWRKMFFVALILVGVAGLKWVTPASN